MLLVKRDHLPVHPAQKRGQQRTRIVTELRRQYHATIAELSSTMGSISLRAIAENLVPFLARPYPPQFGGRHQRPNVVLQIFVQALPSAAPAPGV